MQCISKVDSHAQRVQWETGHRQYITPTGNGSTGPDTAQATAIRRTSVSSGEADQKQREATHPVSAAPFLYSQRAMRTARDISRWHVSASLEYACSWRVQKWLGFGSLYCILSADAPCLLAGKACNDINNMATSSKSTPAQGL